MHNNQPQEYSNPYIRTAIAADPGPRELLEDVPMTEEFVTAGGLWLQVAMVCDGVGGVKSGERAAFMTANETIEFMKRSTDTIVPRLMTTAIENANRKVFHDSTSGKSTIAMLCVHFDGQTPFGRLYVASVGDSGIFLIRDGQLKRLNTEHNVANEMILRGQATPDQAYNRPNASHLTRAIGIKAEVEVDIGFYYNAVSMEQARQRGKAGIALEEGDTLFACSDGLTDLDETGLPFVRDEEFIQHALEAEPERVAKLYLSYALRRGTHDNASVALMFVDSSARRDTLDGGTRFGIPPKIAIPLVLVIIALIAGAVFLFRQQGSELEQTSSELTAVAQGIQEATALKLTEEAYTPTPSQTPSPTPTPSPTTTALPTLGPGQAGHRIDVSGASQVISERDVLQSEAAGFYVSIGEFIAGEKLGYFFFMPNSGGQFLSVTNEKIEFLMHEDGEVFIQTQGYRQGTEIEVSAAPSARFFVSGSCMSVAQAADTIRVACFSGNCSYNLQRGVDPIGIDAGDVLTVDIEGRDLVPSIAPISISDATRFDEMLKAFNAPGTVIEQTCAGSYIPTPTPTFTATRRPATRTPTPTIRATNTRSTSDADSDGVIDSQDSCKFVPGPASNGGCPLPDADNDGVPDEDDNCPNQSGPASNGGCPLPTNTPRPPTNTPVPPPTNTPVPPPTNTPVPPPTNTPVPPPTNTPVPPPTNTPVPPPSDTPVPPPSDTPVPPPSDTPEGGQQGDGDSGQGD